MEPGLKNRNLPEKSGVTFKCSSELCRSCSASYLADCVAISCCPCAVINLLVFTFVKLPWLVGRRVIARFQKKLQKRRKRRLKEEEREGRRDDGSRESVRTIEGVVEGSFGLGVEDFEVICGGFEAERALMELYQVAHLGFGRLSFTGIQVKTG